MQVPTRERLLREGLRLFASRGFDGTTVGDIEAAAGLKPRRGGLYRHFPSKLALLEAAVARHNATARRAAFEFTRLPVEDPRELALLVGRWMLADLDAQRAMTHVLEREGNRLQTVRDEFRVGSDAGFQAAAALVRKWAADGDAEVVGVVLLGALVNFRRSAWTLGLAPLELDDERFLVGFADVFSKLVKAT